MGDIWPLRFIPYHCAIEHMANSSLHSISSTLSWCFTSKAIVDLQKQREDELKEGVNTKLPDFDDIEVRNGTFVCIFNTELAKQVILDWKGVGLKGEELELTPKNIELLMADGFLQEQFVSQYMELQREIEEEKK